MRVHTSPVFNQIHTAADLAEKFSARQVCTEIFHPSQPPAPFSSLVASVNVQNSDGSLLLEMQVCQGGVWSKFYQLGYFSAQENKSFSAQEDAVGRVAVDELQLTRPAQQYRLRLTVTGAISWREVHVCGVYAPFVYDEEKAALLPPGACALPVNPLSQKEQSTPEKDRICSPTSLCMALNALGKKVTLLQVMQGVHDSASCIYGNWIFNTAYASRRGLDAYVRRFSALSELAEFCTEKSLVIASVSYGENELPGSPQGQTSGHLILVRGWQDGKILTADPAACCAKEVLRAYDAKAFARAWLKNKQGAAYIVRKR